MILISHFIKLGLILIFLNIKCLHSEIFTSIGHLTTLVQSIDGITRNLEGFMVMEYENLEKARE
jgi:hypothetical protein